MIDSRTLVPGTIDRNSVIEVDGIEVHVAGDGPRPMVFVHGWPDTWRLWERQVAHFAKCDPAYGAGVAKRTGVSVPSARAEAAE